jgi:mRNA degradation ribonuclease J1/J2
MAAIPNIDKYEVVIVGDFILDHKAKNQVAATLLDQFAAEHALQQMITEPTRCTQTTNKNNRPCIH